MMTITNLIKITFPNTQEETLQMVESQRDFS